MTKIVTFDNSIDTYIKRAENAYVSDDIVTACGYIQRIIKHSPMHFEANMLLAQIYAELAQFDASNQIYFNLISAGYKEEVFEAIITNLLQTDDLQCAKYYNDKYQLDYDFSQFVNANAEELDYGDIELDIKPQKFKLIVSKKTKSGKNLISEQDLQDNSDVKITDKDFNEFIDYMHKFLNGEISEDDKTFPLPKIKKVLPNFKQVFPKTNSECDEILEQGFQLFTEGEYEESLNLLNQVNERNGSRYYQAEKIKSMNYLALNQLNSMRESVEIASKGLPDDYSIKCYHFMVLNLLGEKKEAEKVFCEIMATNPENIMEQMNRLDVCRLAEYHKGVLAECRKVLEDLPYHPVFLLLYAKAQYNIGAKKSAVISLKNIRKMYPYLWETDILLDSINSGATTLSYSEIEMEVKRTTSERVVVQALQTHSFDKYLKSGKNAVKNVHFVLTNENETITNAFINKMSKTYSPELRKVFDLVLMDNRISDDTKKQVLKAIFINDTAPQIKLLSGNIYKKFTLQPLIESEKTPNILYEAYYSGIADLVINELNFEKPLIRLSGYMNRLIKTVNAMEDTDKLFCDLKGLRNVEILKVVLAERALKPKNKTGDKSVNSSSRATYLKYKNIITGIEARYENN